jgi:hypothetical protein
MAAHDHERRVMSDGARLEPDPVIDTYKRDLDRTLVREQLRRTPDERVRNMIAALRFAEALRHAGRDGGRRD